VRVLKEDEAGVRLRTCADGWGVREVTFYRWKAKFGGLEVSEAKRQLEEETAAQAPGGRADAGQSGTEGGAVKKVAGPAMKREAVRVARGEAGLSATRLWTAGDGPCELSLPKAGEQGGTVAEAAARPGGRGRRFG